MHPGTMNWMKKSARGRNTFQNRLSSQLISEPSFSSEIEQDEQEGNETVYLDHASPRPVGARLSV